MPEKETGEPEEATDQEAADRTEDGSLREQLSEVYHDLNNSLAVISGNAQLLAEMAQAEDLDPVFTESVADVEAARAEISEVLERLDRLRKATDQRESENGSR